jgi:hypothetical protein
MRAFRANVPIGEVVDESHRLLGQFLLIYNLAPPCLHHKIGSGFLTETIVTEKGKDARPLRGDRLSFIALQSFVNLTQIANLSRYILLPQIQHRPPIPMVFAKILG